MKFPVNRNKSQLVLVILLSFALLVNGQVYLALAQTSANTVDRITEQKNQLQAKLNAINAQIQSYQTQISNTKKQAASLKNEVVLFDSEIKSTELQMQAKETQIEETNLQIAEIERQIEIKKQKIEENKTVLKELILELYQQSENSYIQLGFGTADFSEFLDQVQYTTNVQGKVYQIVQNIKAVKAKLEEQRTELTAQLKSLEALKEQLEQSQQALAVQRNQKQKLLDQTKGVERNYQTLLSASKNEEANLQKEIEDLDSALREKLGNRTIAPGKGALAKPMSGIITQKYGNTGFTALGYNFHNGIDIAAPAGEPIYSAADGTVVSCDTGEASYGNWCAVKHSISTKSGNRNIITIYGHMRSFKVKAGQALALGDLIGYEGNTGNTTRLLYGPHRGYHLHFMVCDAEGFGIANGKYTNIYGPYTVPYCYTYNPLDFI